MLAQSRGRMRPRYRRRGGRGNADISVERPNKPLVECLRDRHARGVARWHLEATPHNYSAAGALGQLASLVALIVNVVAEGAGMRQSTSDGVGSIP